MRIIGTLVYRFKYLILTITLLCGAALGYQIINIGVETDMIKFLPQDEESVVLFKDTGEKFGVNYMNVIALEADDVFTRDFLFKLGALSAEVKALKGVKDVFSLSRISDVKKVEGGLEVSDLIQDYKTLPEDPAFYAE